MQQGITRVILQDLDGSETCLTEARSFNLRHGHFLGVLISQWYLGRVAWMRGRLRAAVAVYGEGLRIVGGEAGRPGPGAGMFFAGLTFSPLPFHGGGGPQIRHSAKPPTPPRPLPSSLSRPEP